MQGFGRDRVLAVRTVSIFSQLLRSRERIRGSGGTRLRQGSGGQASLSMARGIGGSGATPTAIVEFFLRADTTDPTGFARATVHHDRAYRSGRTGEAA